MDIPFTYLWWFVLTVLYGAATGSFLNVVVYRMPLGRSLWKPMSCCPICGAKLKIWHNLPILSWILLLGKCGFCRTRIPFRYPLLEIVCAALFGGLCWSYYESGHFYRSMAFAGFRPEFAEIGPIDTWPVLIVHVTLLAVLLSASVIDYKHYIIPLSLPYFAMFMALLMLPIASIWYGQTWAEQEAKAASGLIVPRVTDGQTLAMVAYALVGLVIANLMVMFRLLPRSFELPEFTEEQIKAAEDAQARGDAKAYLEALDGTTAQWLAFPHPRREALKELLFLVLPAIGVFVGYKLPWTLAYFEWDAWPQPIQILGGIFMGYMVAAIALWAIRIFGTLVFGKEAMGFGDVHLIGAIGAIIGAFDGALLCVLAPFPALALFAAQSIGRLVQKQKTEPVIYFGPAIAIAAIIVMLFRHPLFEAIGLPY